MNTDVLKCKRKAQELVTSGNAPFNRNGRRKGYIEVMKELWEEKGYGNLGLKSQNLRDQASRLEKNQDALMETSATGQTVMDESGLDATHSESKIADNIISSEKRESSQDQNDGGKPSQIANRLMLELHISAVQTPEECGHSTSENALNDAPGCLLNYEAINAPSTFVWGQHGDGRTITVSSSTIDNAYYEISEWRKNTFLVPYRKVGREFIDKMTEDINDWNNGSKMQPIALKAAIVLLAVGLQKPSQKSKTKDHQECLAKRLVLWKEGETEKLLREGRMIQKLLSNSRRVDPPNAAIVFANLVMSGQINSAFCYVSENDGGRGGGGGGGGGGGVSCL